MTAPHRLPVDAVSMRVERWLGERRATLPPPDPGRVLERVTAELARTPQHHDRRTAVDVSNLAPPWPADRGTRRGSLVADPPATIVIALSASLAMVTVLTWAFLLNGTSAQRTDGDAIVPGAVTGSPPAAEQTPGLQTVERTDILPGARLEVEEVEPGVLRVVSDGIRELMWERGTDGRYPASFHGGAVVVGRDGSVWNLTYPAVAPSDACEGRCTLMYRLGSSETLRGPDPFCHTYGCAHGDDLVVDADGTPWAVWPESDGDELRAFDGSEWTVRRKLPAKGRLLQVVIDRQDGVWASWQTPKGQSRVGQLTDNGWDVYEPESVAPDGLVPHGLRGVVTFSEDGAATRMSSGVSWGVDGIGAGSVGLPVTGDDGSHWWLVETAPGLRQLIRSNGLDSTAVDVGDETGQHAVLLGVSADGSVWLRSGGPICDGLVRFDGQGWTRYLPGACVSSVAFGEDGSVWLQDSASTQVQTYVIRPAEAG